MSELVSATGKCLCGRVEIQATMSTHVGACHCTTCRKWTGGPMFATECHGEVSISNEEHVSRYQSSDWAERGFCNQCGTHLFYHLLLNDQYIIPVGIFDTDAALQFDHQVFIDEKPAFYTFANDTKNITGEEVFAQFSSE